MKTQLTSTHLAEVLDLPVNTVRNWAKVIHGQAGPLMPGSLIGGANREKGRWNRYTWGDVYKGAHLKALGSYIPSGALSSVAGHMAGHSLAIDAEAPNAALQFAIFETDEHVRCAVLRTIQELQLDLDAWAHATGKLREDAPTEISLGVTPSRYSTARGMAAGKPLIVYDLLATKLIVQQRLDELDYKRLLNDPLEEVKIAFAG